MEKKIQNYLHLYLGCEYRIRYIDYQVGEYTVWSKLTAARLSKLEDLSIAEIQIQLLPLSDITEEEMKELWHIVFKRPFHPTGRILSSYLQDKKNPRWILMSGVERLGIQLNGDIWADSDLHNWPMNPHLNTMYLLKQGFDLFGLIEAGLAIDKTKNI